MLAIRNNISLNKVYEVIQDCLFSFSYFFLCIYRTRNWNCCPKGYYLSGLYRSGGHNLHNIEHAWCCKPRGAPNSYKSCYNENVWSKFDWNRQGMVSCSRAGYYITGLYRSTCNYMYCIEEFKCCQLPSTGGGYNLLWVNSFYDLWHFSGCSMP